MLSRNLQILIALSVLAIPALSQSPAQFTSVTIPGPAASSRAFTLGERHLSTTTVGTLYSNSAFAHGFRHGYDEGFHVGDLDLQMGRKPPLQRSTAHQRSTHDYDLSFGSKRLFQQGYEDGFRSGYNDAIAGLPFAVSARARVAAQGLNDILAPTRRQLFDEGFAGGYLSAQSSGAPHEHLTADYLDQYCRNQSESHPLEYCSGFSHGYLFGATDSSAPTTKVASSASTTR